MTDATQRAARKATLLTYLAQTRLRLLAIASRLRAELPAVQAAGLDGAPLRAALDEVEAEPSEGVCGCSEYGCAVAHLPRQVPSHYTYQQRQRALAEPRPPAETRPLVRYFHGRALVGEEGSRRPECRLSAEAWELSTRASEPLKGRLEAAEEEISAITLDGEIYLERSGETRDQMCARYEREAREDDAWPR